MLLDDVKNIRKIDRSNMLERIEFFPAQCSEAKRIAEEYEIPPSLKRHYKNIVFTGLGGSAIGADILRSYLSNEMAIPVLVNRNYTLPHFVNNESLVVVSSYSGDTEETLSAYRDARVKKANILVVTSGGKLLESADTDKVAAVVIPKDMPPRSALGYSFFPMLIALSKLKLIKEKTWDIDEAIRVMDDMRKKRIGIAVSSRVNAAKKAAMTLYRKYPVIYTCQDYFDAVATRWRGQLAENAKTLASSNVFPEMNHNEIAGWQNPPSLLKNFAAVFLKDSGSLVRIAKRMDVTKKILEKEKVRVLEVNSEGRGLLARIFSLVYIGDYVSFYLAVLNKVDPTSIDRINYLKSELAKV